ncbi:hypothetical protein [Marasmitruncus massiliensis]|uniref:hypothetical protein n=1 Tax=Marasmitruncus massiliensis TaxID=1944642 RepID=UPI0015E0D1EE|nr:hypothetical protein [Marasmitruncus massiliensis]
MEKYADMYALLNSNRQAKQYFDSLPDYVREHISTRSDSVQTFESLCDYAENLLRGDD